MSITRLVPALAIAALGHSPAASVPASGAASLPDSASFPVSWQLAPRFPCVDDSVFVVVRGFVATPCDSFIGAERVGRLHVRIRTLVRDGYACLIGPTHFYPVPVALGMLPAGEHTLTVSHEITHLAPDGSTYAETRSGDWRFTVSAKCPTTPPPGTLPYVHRIRTEPPRACAGASTRLIVEGAFPSGCGQVVGARLVSPELVEITLKPDVLPDTACALVITPWRRDFNLGLLPSGGWTTKVALTVVALDSAGTGFRREHYTGAHQFYVYERCDTVPPPPGPLPYVRDIWVGRDCPGDSAPLCPRDSISVWVRGVFPNDCFSLRRVLLLPSPILTVPPPPPTVRLIVDDGGCLGRPCLAREVPWSASVRLPPSFPAHHLLNVQLAQVTCSDSFPPGTLYRTQVPFRIGDSCHVQGRCLVTNWAPGPDPGSHCNATIGYDRPAVLTFMVRPGVALAGLQGEFKLSPPLLRVDAIEPIGPAEGMLLQWTRTPEGARFVLFAESGAPIPPGSPAIRTGGPPDAGLGWPVLRVTLGFYLRVEIPEFTHVTAENLLGSDIDGQGVPLCQPSPCEPQPTDLGCPPPCSDTGLRVRGAIVCAERACDFNADGLADVRDLVLMVRCIRAEGPCPPEPERHFDCNRDSAFTLADVVCCARHILLRAPCPDCPPGPVRPEPAVGLSFGTPVTTAEGVVLPLRVHGTDRLGAALLRLQAPLDRYELVSVAAKAGSRWLLLHEVGDRRIELGLIDARGARDPGEPATLDLTLHLALKPGATPGGEVSAAGGEFSGPDGVMLDVHLGAPAQPLPGPARVVLGASRPNPASDEARFTLELVEAADVTVAIYDLRGRAVATLFRGRLPSGPHEFRWDGRLGDGSAAADGVYFYQVSFGGRTLARKLVLMRRD